LLRYAIKDRYSRKRAQTQSEQILDIDESVLVNADFLPNKFLVPARGGTESCSVRCCPPILAEQFACKLAEANAGNSEMTRGFA